MKSLGCFFLLALFLVLLEASQPPRRNSDSDPKDPDELEEYGAVRRRVSLPSAPLSSNRLTTNTLTRRQLPRRQDVVCALDSVPVHWVVKMALALIIFLAFVDATDPEHAITVAIRRFLLDHVCQHR